MQQTLQFDGSTECRGRNGWFQLHDATIRSGYDRHQAEHQATVHLYSLVHGQMPPILLIFHNPEELKQLICGLAKALHCMTNPEEEQHGA